MTSNGEAELAEIRTCEVCGKSYEHEPFFFFEEPGEEDRNVDLYTCPECLQIAAEREERERLEREDQERHKAREKAAQAAWEKLVPSVYRKTSINHPDFPGLVHRKVKDWQQDPDTLPLFGLIGPTGKGKTRIASEAVKAELWKGKRCQWVNAAKFQRLVQSQWDNSGLTGSGSVLDGPEETVGQNARKQIRSFRECDFLVLDDLGKGRLTETVAGSLYELIEERTADDRRTLWTSNANLKELLRMLPLDCGKPIVRRLLDFSNIIEL